MQQPVNVFEKGQRALKSLYSLGAYLTQCSVEQPLLHLIYFRVSQLNGCAYCLDMHSKDLRAAGEPEHRLFVLNAWREAPFYTERERAALAWAEALTQLNGAPVADAAREAALQQFTEQELIDLTFAVITINSYNRVNLAFPNPAMVGSYVAGQYAVGN